MWNVRWIRALGAGFRVDEGVMQALRGMASYGGVAWCLWMMSETCRAIGPRRASYIMHYRADVQAMDV